MSSKKRKIVTLELGVEWPTCQHCLKKELAKKLKHQVATKWDYYDFRGLQNDCKDQNDEYKQVKWKLVAYTE